MRGIREIVFAVTLLLSWAGLPHSATIAVPHPRVEKLAGIRVGSFTMGELERRLGPGKVETGGHPQGARLWRSKQTGWFIYADGFDFGKDGTYIVNQVTFSVDIDGDWKKGVPSVDFNRKQFEFLKSVNLGTSKSQVLRALKKASLRIRSATTDSVSVDKKDWHVTFRFKNRRLNRIDVWC